MYRQEWIVLVDGLGGYDMNITDLIELIVELRDKAIDELLEMRKAKMPCSSYGAGYEDGTVATCQYLLDRISGKIE